MSGWVKGGSASAANLHPLRHLSPQRESGPYLSPQPQEELERKYLAIKVPSKQPGDAFLKHERGKCDKFCCHSEKEGPISMINQTLRNLSRPLLTLQVESECKISTKTLRSQHGRQPCQPSTFGQSPPALKSLCPAWCRGSAAAGFILTVLFGEHSGAGGMGGSHPSITQLSDL